MRPFDPLPSELSGMFPRQRQLLSIIYESGGATLHEMRARIPDPPTIWGLRTLLNRLARKGVIRKRRSGRHTEIFYLPAVVTERAKLKAFDRLVDEHFNGSPTNAFAELAKLAHRESAD